MRNTVRLVFALSLAGEAAACGKRTANARGDSAEPAAAPMDSNESRTGSGAGSPAASPDAAQAPPKETRFTHGEATLTYGKPVTWKLAQGKILEFPKSDFGPTEEVYLEYSTSGKTTGEDGLTFNAGHHSKGGSFNIDDMRITGHGFWRISSEAHCTISMTEATQTAVRGVINCPGDPKGPTGPIRFSATP